MAFKKRAFAKKRTMGKRKSLMRKKKGVTAGVKRAIKVAIARNVENKTSQYFSTGTNIYPSNSASFPNPIPLAPTAGWNVIAQGTGQGDRIGNSITIKNIRMKGTVYPKPYNVGTNAAPRPSQVIMWICYLKQFPTSTPQAIDMPGFLQLGNASANLQNQLMDCWAPVNEDKWRILGKRVFKIGYHSYEGTGATAGAQNFANNDFKLNQNFSLNLTKYAIKHQKYLDTSTVPSTRNFFLLFTAVSANGGNYGATEIPCEMSYVIDVDYEDA